MSNSNYKCKYYQEETLTVSEDSKVLSCNSKIKMNINERSFIKVYTDSLCVTPDVKYKDLVFLYTLGKYMDDMNIVHLNIPTRKKLQSDLGDIHKSAISNTVKKLVNLGLLYKVLDNIDFKVLRAVYMIHPKLISKNNAGIMRKLEWYVNMNARYINVPNMIIYPKVDKYSKGMSIEVSNIPEELRNDDLDYGKRIIGG